MLRWDNSTNPGVAYSCWARWFCVSSLPSSSNVTPSRGSLAWHSWTTHHSLRTHHSRISHLSFLHCSVWHSNDNDGGARIPHKRHTAANGGSLSYRSIEHYQMITYFGLFSSFLLSSPFASHTSPHCLYLLPLCIRSVDSGFRLSDEILIYVDLGVEIVEYVCRGSSDTKIFE